MTDDTFLEWFAGFTDGEGCFGITPIKRKGNGIGGYVLRCIFVIELRADDVAILREISRQTGIGRVTFRRARTSANPQARLVVDSKPWCRQLVSIFDAHPLRAKKARDYSVWREAVKVWTEESPGQHGNVPIPQKLIEKLAVLKIHLEMLRAYVPVEQDYRTIRTMEDMR